jgi:3-deoxy-7-phosphoheptulonate synthase
MFSTDDTRIEATRPLIPPAILMEEVPLGEEGKRFVFETRRACEGIIRGEDDRLIAVVGPCSIHDVQAGRDYAEKLKGIREELKADLEIVMRVYFEKPRSRSGWKGLINDPYIDGSFQINKGLRIARRFLVDVVEQGVPAGCEFLDTITPQFIADCVTWGAIGARTTESQVHRQLASGLSTPVGFKNGTDGNARIAIDAIHAAKLPHRFLSVTKQGVAAIVETKGNPVCHLILRGSSKGPNYDAAYVEKAAKALVESKLLPKIMIDFSHGNSQKDPSRQPAVAHDVAAQVAGGSTYIFGFMIESHIKAGSQPEAPLPALEYGKSITDACLSWEDTVPVLRELAEAVRARRALRTGR